MQEHIVDAAPDPAVLDHDQPPNACVNYHNCGNEAPTNNHICTECLDAARKSDREASYTDYAKWLRNKLTP